MFKWKVEEMVLMNNHNEVYTGLNREKVTTYSCESSVSREDKISFVDSLQNGKLSYIISLIEKFNNILGCERNIQNSHSGTYDYYDDLTDSTNVQFYIIF